MSLVIKVGDKVMVDAFSEKALDDLGAVTRRYPTILVHGGGNTVTGIAEKLGVHQQFVTSPEGFRSRYTDIDTIQIYTMVMAGKINKQIVTKLLSRKIPAIGLSGIDGGLIRANRKKKLIVNDERGRRKAIEGGYTGLVTHVEGSLLRTLMEAGYVPVIAPIALSEENEPLNIDGDRTAGHVATAVSAETLLLMTDVEGVTLPSGLIRSLSANEVKQNLPNIGPGMITKVFAAQEAISAGTRRVIVAPGKGDLPYTAALNGERGTSITP
ncbi:MAG TPA: [LysW]-aminoadipate/[LysW]-glutamate kinase [Terriglobales bacterium]|nr:[LysW]-aminoadipate/[LysW]-glutamate kinase [Terriglobales bacterium]